MAWMMHIISKLFAWLASWLGDFVVVELNTAIRRQENPYIQMPVC
jgi:hypothetical protein